MREDQHGARAVARDAGLDLERPVIGMAAAAGDRHRAVRQPPARDRQRQLAGVEPRPFDQQRPGRAQADRAREAQIGARDRGQRVVCDARHAALEVGAQRPDAAIVEAGGEARVDIGGAEVGHREAACRRVAAQAVAPARQIAAQHQPRGEAGNADADVVRRQAIALEQQRGGRAAIDQPAVGNGIAGDHPRHHEVERDRPAAAVVRGDALLGHALDPVAAQAGPGDGQRVIDGQVAERAVEHRARPRALEPHVAAQQRRVEEIGGEAHLVEAVTVEVGGAIRMQRQRRATEVEPAAQHRPHERALGLERDRLARRARGQARKPVARPGEAVQRIAPGAVAEPQRGEIAAVLARDEEAVPALPAALAAEPHGDAALRLGKPGEKAARRRGVVEREVEPVGRRRGVDQREQLVLPAEAAVGAQQGAAVADIDFGDQVDPPLLTDHAARNGEVVDLETIGANVKVGQQRRIGIAGVQAGQARQGAAPGDEAADIQAFGEPVERPPVELDPGNAQEHALGIGEGHVAQHRRAVERAFDPPDGDAHARSGRIRGDTVGDEAVADRAVENRHDQREEEEHAEHRLQQQLGPAQAAPGSLSCPQLPLNRRWIALFGHQNACPSEI